MEDPRSTEQDISRFLKVLEALKQASHHLQLHPGSPTDTSSSAIKALLELETESETILSKDPLLSTLSQHLSRLKSLVQASSRGNGHRLTNFLTRRVSTHSISRVAESIESELQAWIDRESIESLSAALKDRNKDDAGLVSLLTQFEGRLAQGFNLELQDLVLKSKILSLLEKIICDPNWSNSKIKEQCAFVVAALIQFNKDVFVGQVLMGPLIHALVSMASRKSMSILCVLIKLIKSPFVDEIESNGEIPKIISFLGLKDLQLRVMTMDCILEIGYFGRKEAIEAMIKQGLIKKLVELQRSELGGDLIDMGRFDDAGDVDENGNDKKRDDDGVEGKKESKKKRVLERHPFASCVARFAVQLEVGEGLRKREKRAFKREILERVREASVSDAEAATIVAEVLWGSSP